MSQDAKDSIYAWMSVTFCAIFFVVTLRLLRGVNTLSWQPWLSGVLCVITFINVIRLIRSRRNMRKAEGSE